MLREQGHELGCHTHDHCHAWDTEPEQFEASILRNGEAFRRVLPGCKIETLSYPIGNPRPENKRRAAKYFRGCRAGGQTYNSERCDLNYLQAFFLEQSREDVEAIRQLVDESCRNRGWLIFATHDVTEDPTPYGITPGFFEEIVQYCVASGAALLPMSQALDLIDARPQ